MLIKHLSTTLNLSIYEAFKLIQDAPRGTSAPKTEPIDPITVYNAATAIDMTNGPDAARSIHQLARLYDSIPGSEQNLDYA